MNRIQKISAACTAGALVVGMLSGCEYSYQELRHELRPTTTTTVTAAPTQNVPENGGSTSDDALLETFDSGSEPNYYKVTGKAQFTSATTMKAGQIKYEGIDSLGRTGYAYGNITYAMYEKSAGWRAPFADDVKDISGWYYNGRSNNGKASIQFANGRVYNGYFYNRSHLIADSLGGASSRENVITGTRPQNVGDNSGNPGGMAYTETEARNLLKKNHNATILYDVTPIYLGNELVARGTTVDIRSSDGSIDQHVVVWNYANGYAINYNTGQWSKALQ